MDQETILRRYVTPVQNDGDGPFTHAILPGLFRAAIVKPRNDKNSQKNDCRRRRDCGIACKSDVKLLGSSNVHLGSSNFSIADLILIGNVSGETLSSDHTRPSCPAYRFCVGRASTAAAATSVTGVTVDHEDSVISSELPTLRELLKPIKQTAMRMKRLSQINDECCEPENDIGIEESSRCQICGMRTRSMQNSNEEIEQQFDMFGEGDKLTGLDGNVYVKIISGLEGGQLSSFRLMKIIEQLISQMPNMQVEHSDRTKIPISNIVNEYTEMQDIGIQSPGWLNGNNETFDDDADSVQSYEFIKTMDIGCGSEPETRHNNVCCNGENQFNDCQNDQNGSVDPILLNILTILKDIQQAELKRSNAKQTHISEPMCSMDSKSRALKDSMTETKPRQDKSVDCTCGFKSDPGSKSNNKVEVTNAVSFKSSYVLENLETVSVNPENQSHPPNCCSKDVSTYTMSVFKQITSMSQSKITTSRKRSSSCQCNIGPQSISKLFSNDKNQSKKEVRPQKTASFREPATIPETIEEPCPCGCGFFLEGDDTCSCGCDESPDASHQTANIFESKYTMDSMKKSKISRESCEDKKHIENCYDCGCNDDTQTRDVPLDPVVKLMNCRYTENEETVINSIHLGTDQEKEAEGMDLEAEARKLQQKIQCYRKENEYFRKLIQQACSGCQENADALSRTPPIRATYSGLATAIDILQAKCRSKDGMIAILAEGLRGVVNYAQIAKNLAAPCLEYTYWDFDQSTLYTYLRGTISKLSVEAKKSGDPSKKDTKCLSEPCKKKCAPPPPTDFKVQELCKCLFASWKIPENISNVVGYRIYVNGNVATNVRSATRTETILGFMNTPGPTELVLHSFDMQDVLSDPVTITYSPNNT